MDPFVLDSRSFAPFRFRHDLARRPPEQHINLLGEYDFSDEKLRDSVGIRPPKLTPLKRSKIWGLPNRVMCFSHQDL